jgi:dolichol-phosphate mannosyltransferase
MMLLSVVIPVFNEGAVLPALLGTLPQIAAHVDPEYEIILVDDGSSDDSVRILAEAAARNPHLKVLAFTRNFGQQAAITAGLDAASGNAVIVMDADLQDPPDLIPEMIRLYQEGYDIVSPQRVQRSSESLTKRFTAAAFYWFMRKMVDRRLVPEVGDFRLFSSSALRGIRTFREQHRFLRGLVAWLGLKEAILPFERPARRMGETKYSLFKMLAFSWTAVTSFSALPLRFCLAFGLVLTGVGCLAVLWVIYGALFRHDTAWGWASLVILQCTFSGAILVAVGLLGEYVSRIYEESKFRPLYVVGQSINCPALGEVPRALVLVPRRTTRGAP